MKLLTGTSLLRTHGRALLIATYIVAVLLFSGLARADQTLLSGVASIFGF